MKRAILVCTLALAGCGGDLAGAAHDGGHVGDGGGSHGGGDGGDDGSGGHTDGGGIGGDGGGTGDGGGGGSTHVIPNCSDAATTYGLPTGASFTNVYIPGPLMARGDRAFVFVEGTPQWTIAQAGSGTTSVRPAPLDTGVGLGGFSSLSGISVIVYRRANIPRAITFTGGAPGPEIEIPCGPYGCDAHAAGDGHLWVQAHDVTSSTFYEQTGSTFTNRGGGPPSPLYWDVDATGTVIVIASGDWTNSQELLSLWKLAPGAGGWTKIGALMRSDVAAVAATIEGGFGFGEFGPGTIAADGSFHVFSDPHNLNNGGRNKTQVYARSRDGVQWTVETLPDPDTLYAGNKSWRHAAFWAGSYDDARYAVVTSDTPVLWGSNWIFPDKRFDVIGRCLDANSAPTFGRLGSASMPAGGRGYAVFSETGRAATLTEDGWLTQIDSP